MSAPVSFIECVSKMAYTRVLSCVMLALISSIIASRVETDIPLFKIYSFFLFLCFIVVIIYPLLTLL